MYKTTGNAIELAIYIMSQHFRRREELFCWRGANISNILTGRVNYSASERRHRLSVFNKIAASDEEAYLRRQEIAFTTK